MCMVWFVRQELCSTDETANQQEKLMKTIHSTFERIKEKKHFSLSFQIEKERLFLSHHKNCFFQSTIQTFNFIIPITQTTCSCDKYLCFWKYV